MNKVVVIGIDGGTFDIIRPMVKKGELPVISSLMEKGVWGELESTIPPDTAPAWVSMMTGVNPGKHGVFFFLDNLHNNYGHAKTLNSADIKSPPLWSVLSKHNKKVNFVNVPFTYPPMEVNGVVISGMIIPHSAEVLSYPQHIYPDLDKRLDGYEIDDWSPSVLGVEKKDIKSRYGEVVKGIRRIAEKRKKAFLNLMDEYDWDFSMTVFTSTDRYQHLFWDFMDKEGEKAGSKERSVYGQAIYDGYRQIDKAIDEILKKAGPDATVILTSDHGFGPLKKHFYVNKWLEEIGLLKLKEGISPQKIALKKLTLQRILRKLFPGAAVPGWTKKLFLPRLKRMMREREELIDWGQTKAYGNQSGINLNLSGREPQGIVEPGEKADEVLAYIEEKFSLLEDEKGNRIGDWIKRKEEIFHGPYADEAVDLYFSVNKRSYLQNSRIDMEEIYGDSDLGSGMHRMNGIFLMSGPFCRKNLQVKSTMVDIAPTVLYLMGLPILENMDGRVIEEAIDPDYLKKNPVRISKFEGGGRGGASFTDEDEEKIQESLKGLGYLS